MLDPQALAQLPLLRDLSPATLAVLARHAVERSYGTDEVLWMAGADPRGLFIVRVGRVRVVRGRGDRQHVVHVEGAGGTLGEVPLFAGGAYPATAIAAEPTHVVVLSREAIQAAIAADPEFAFVLLARLADRVRTLVDRLDRLATQGANARLARFLLERPESARTRSISLGMTQSELAEELGTVREVVVRGLRALGRSGAIRSLGGGRYEITCRETLRKVAEA
jgi:CRP/FNR family transcriptional regulator